MLFEAHFLFSKAQKSQMKLYEMILRTFPIPLQNFPGHPVSSRSSQLLLCSIKPMWYSRFLWHINFSLHGLLKPFFIHTCMHTKVSHDDDVTHQNTFCPTKSSGSGRLASSSVLWTPAALCAFADDRSKVITPRDFIFEFSY